MQSILLTTLLFSVSGAQPIESPAEVGQDLASKITAQSGILGAVLIGAGLVLCFLGIRLFKAICFLGGFYFGACIGFIILSKVEPATLYGSRDNVYLFGCLAIGLVCGVLFLFFWRLGLAAVGALAGFTLAMFILSFKTGGLIESGTGRTVFIIVMSLAGALLISFFEKIIIITSTAFIGAFSTVYGVDVFIHKGFVEAVQSFIGDPSIVYTVSTPVYGMLGGVIGGTALGMFVQFGMFGNREHRDGYKK